MIDPQPPRTPILHDTGGEARRRVMVGMGGLLLMLLLVMLAGYLSGQFRDGDPKAASADPAAATAAPTAPPTEPLGDGAVDPSVVPPITPPDAALVPDGEGGVVVPDLQPDPELEAATAAQ